MFLTVNAAGEGEEEERKVESSLFELLLFELLCSLLSLDVAAVST